MKKQKGITLVALVVTIIVLLILAGVSITMISGDDGIAMRAAEAKNETEEKSQEELDRLAGIDDYIDEKLNATGTQSPTPDVVMDIYQKLYLKKPAGSSGLKPFELLGEPDGEKVWIYKTNDLLILNDIKNLDIDGATTLFSEHVNNFTYARYLDFAYDYLYVWVEYEDGTTTNALRFDLDDLSTSTEVITYGTVVE